MYFLLNPKSTIQIVDFVSLEAPIKKLSGYDIKECIYDIYGSFYIIHPDEDKFKRNILTGFIIDDNTDNNYYISKKIYYNIINE